MRRWVLLGLAAALLAGGAAAAILALRESRSSSGPLACPPGCAHLTLAFPVDPRRPFTYGLLLLRNRGGEAAVLERVGARDLSPGMQLVGAVVVPTRDNPWHVTADDHAHFPPPNVAQVVRPLQGYELLPAREPSDYTEVLLGLEVARAGMFSFRGLALDYRVAGRRYRAVFPYRLRVCAPARLHRRDCQPLPL